MQKSPDSLGTRMRRKHQAKKIFWYLLKLDSNEILYILLFLWSLTLELVLHTKDIALPFTFVNKTCSVNN